MGTRDDALEATLPDPASSELRSASTYQVLAGRYEVLGLLGAGGMGAVYRARDLVLDELVALKTLRSELVNPEMLERFRREVKLARKVTHTHVARVFDIGEHEGERFFTMELVEGESLGSLLRRAGALSARRTSELGLALCEGLSAAHHAGVVHGDLKPDNVMIAVDGRVVITDFGIAESIGAARVNVSGIVGTPTYMAPEQVDRKHRIDHRADLYALGALLYESATGQPPWRGETALATAVARLLAPPPDPRELRPDLPSSLAATILRCMAREPSERPADAAQVGQQLAPSATTTVPPAPSLRQVRPRAWTATPGRRVAVLPLVDRDGNFERLALGLTEDLVDGLTMVAGLRVVSGSATPPAAGSEPDVRRVGRELDVQVVIEGTLERSDDERLQLFLRATSTTDGIQLWAQRFVGTESELLAMNDAACSAIADALAVVSPARGRSLEDPVAIDLYLQARAQLRGLRGVTVDDAARLLEQALERAPYDPILLSSYASCLARTFFYSGAYEGEAREAAMRALASAPDLGESHLALATIDFQCGHYTEAASSVSLALDRAPSLAEAHLLRARILAECGPASEAHTALQLAYALDRGHWIALAELARLAALSRRWSDVDAHLDEMAHVAPTGRGEVTRLIVQARMAMWRGEPAPIAEACRAVEDRLKAGVDIVGPFLVARHIAQCARDRTPLQVDSLKRQVAGAAGSRRRHLFFNQLGAELASYVGNQDDAFAHLEAAVELRLMDLLWLDGCRALDPLRSDARWAALREAVVSTADPVRTALGGG